MAQAGADHPPDNHRFLLLAPDYVSLGVQPLGGPATEVDLPQGAEHLQCPHLRHLPHLLLHHPRHPEEEAERPVPPILQGIKAANLPRQRADNSRHTCPHNLPNHLQRP